MEHCKERFTDEMAWAAAKAIADKGNDAVIRKNGSGYIILEDKRTIKYQTSG